MKIKPRTVDGYAGQRAAGLMLWVGPLAALSLPGFAADQVCSQTADLIYQACSLEVRDDFTKEQAKCVNEVEAGDRQACIQAANVMRSDSDQLCRDQLTERRKVCRKVGEAPYDPQFEPRNFVSDLKRTGNMNRYLPLKVGNQWEYNGSAEVVKIEILNQTKLIDEVRCVVARDVVSVDGTVIEDTNDWFGQARDGAVWYCGEEVKDYEVFDGDSPRLPELVSLSGSFKSGRDGDKPGVVMPAAPRAGMTFRQEFSIGNAEDISEVVSTNYAYGRNPDLDRKVPYALVSRLCKSDCLVTDNYTPISPGVVERKYYAPGIGEIFTLHLDTGETTQLVGCNFDVRCKELPKP